MDGVEALASLGLEPGADWTEIKRAYRAEIRTHHPDVTAEAGGAEVAARIIEAYSTLAELAKLDQLPRASGTPTVPDEDAVASDSPPASAVISVAREALFDRLLDAAHDVGDVTYIDPDARIVQLLVRLPGWPSSHLTCQLTRRGDDDVIVSTLDSLETRPAPPIEEVVDLLARQLRSK